MDNLIESIRVALGDEATHEQRASGAVACRTILSALEATPGSTIASPQVASQLGALVAAMRGMPAEQLFDIAITKLRTMLPDGAAIEPVKPLAFPLIPITHGGRP